MENHTTVKQLDEDAVELLLPSHYVLKGDLTMPPNPFEEDWTLTIQTKDAGVSCSFYRLIPSKEVVLVKDLYARIYELDKKLVDQKKLYEDVLARNNIITSEPLYD